MIESQPDLSPEELDWLLFRAEDTDDRELIRAVARAVAMARRTTEAERAFRTFVQQVSEEDRKARDAGITFATVREALNAWESDEISFGKLVELVRTAARVLAESGAQSEAGI